MVRVDRIALAVGNLVGKAAVGFFGLMIIVGAFAPRPEPDVPAQSASTVTLKVPKGEPARHVTVVDESGRELAVVSRWFNGDFAVLTRADAGAGVHSLFHAKGTALVKVFGTARQTDIDAQPDGTPKISVTDTPPGFHPFSEPRTTVEGLPGCNGPSILGSISDIRH